MHDQGIDAALRQATDTRRVVIGTGALDALTTIFDESFGPNPAIVVADETTYAAAGEPVRRRLEAAGRSRDEPIIFPGSPAPYADMAHVRRLQARLQGCCAIPVAVGSGTINDLTKLASHRLGRPYVCVATAASMDGYAAFGASISKGGFKQTMDCPAPRAIIADLDVLCSAPLSMTASGYGDLLGKVTAGADWILADALAGEAIQRRAWSLSQDSLRDWIAHPGRLATRDREAIGRLTRGLIMSGLAMQSAGSSRPASGSEHRFSHLWEMEALARGDPVVPHGFKVGVGSIAAAALYECVLRRDFRVLDVAKLLAAWPTRDDVESAVRQAHDIPALAESAVGESLAKYIDARRLRRRLRILQQSWPDLRQRLQTQLLPAAELRVRLEAAGCPTRPEDIGVTISRLRRSYALARTIRRRYTVLDLVTETGILPSCLDDMIAPGGFC